MSTDQLVACALLGVVRRPPDVTALPGPVGDVIRRLTGDPAENLLRAAALDAARRDAGMVPSAATPLARAPDDDVPEVGPRAVRRLEGMLAGPDRDLLTEWLQAVAVHRRRVPARTLPALLDLAARDASLRPAVTAAVGERGRWLADLDPRWRHALDRRRPGVETSDGHPDDDTAWTHGSPAQRLAWLRARRRTDPTAAREALEHSWAAEAVDRRAALARTLGPDAVLDDEPFLERVLDDRSAAVAAAGAELLAALPGSALGRTVSAYALERVVVHPHRRRLELRTAPPAEPRLRRALQLLGQPALAGLGDLSWLLAAVGWTPLSRWAGGPHALLPARLGDRPRHLLHTAWARAALRQRDHDWALALAPSRPGLVALLTPAERDAVLVELLRTGRPADVVEGVAAADGLSLDVVRAWIDRVVHDPTALTWTAPVTRGVLTSGPVAAAEHADVAAQQLDPHDPRRRTLLRVAQVLTDRREMLEEIA